MNKVILIGRLTRDVNLQYTQQGIPMGKFTLAVNRDGKNDKADFIDIIAWRKLAEICSQNIGKGWLVAIEGSLQMRSWEKDGQRHKIAEVVAESVKFLRRPANQETESGPEIDGEDVPF